MRDTATPLDFFVVSKAAQAIRQCCDDYDCWDNATEIAKEQYKAQARRAIWTVVDLIDQALAHGVEAERAGLEAIKKALLAKDDQ